MQQRYFATEQDKIYVIWVTCQLQENRQQNRQCTTLRISWLIFTIATCNSFYDLIRFTTGWEIFKENFGVNFG